MRNRIQEVKPFGKLQRRLNIKNSLYFGVPILIALSSAVFPISSFLRQAMIGFMLIWFVAGSWLFASLK